MRVFPITILFSIDIRYIFEFNLLYFINLLQ